MFQTAQCGTRCLKATAATPNSTCMTSSTTVTSPFRRPEVTSRGGCRAGWASSRTGKRGSRTSGSIPADSASRDTSGSGGITTRFRPLPGPGSPRPNSAARRWKWRGNSTRYGTSRRYEFTPTTCSRGTCGCFEPLGCRSASADTGSQRHLSNTCTFLIYWFAARFRTGVSTEQQLAFVQWRYPLVIITHVPDPVLHSISVSK